MLSVQHLNKSFQKCNFYSNRSILAVVRLNVECITPSSTAPDKIDCVNFLTTRKATKETMVLFALVALIGKI